jgi:hypothetical protein
MGSERHQNAEGSYFADKDAARRAIALASPMLEGAIKDPLVCESGFLYVVIMDPGLIPGACAFEHAVLFEHAVGDKAKWDADYAAFARDKAQVCWRTQRDGHTVRQLMPHLLRASDSGLWGGVCIEGIVVAVSGASSWYDEAFASAIAHCLKAVAKSRALTQPESPNLLIK